MTQQELHEWETERIIEGYPDSNHVALEVCKKCRAMRWVIYAKGLSMIRDSNPKPLPKYCPIHT